MTGLVLVVVILGGGYLLAVAYLGARYPETRWDWDAIDCDEVSFPDDFVWGVAAAAHQVEGGCDNNNWSRWETESAPDGTPRIAGGQKAGRACDHWNRYRDDIQLMKDLGLGSYRFSPAWSKIEPSPGEWNDEAIRHYHDVIDALIAAGIEPMLTIHHFSHPLWFDDLGSFEDESNLDHFVSYAERLFSEYGGKVTTWCTINEPAVFATVGWSQGLFPPGKKDPQLTAEVLANLMTAHARVYAALKAMPGGDEARVGLVKNMFQFDPDRRYHLLDWMSARIAEHVFNGAILGCLKTERFRAFVPGQISVTRDVPGISSSLDFVGLNYYSHFLVRFQANPGEPLVMVERPGDIQTDMPYAIYAEGFYRAIKSIAELGVPVYITENGIADATDDRRELFIRRYLHAMHRAMAEGADIRGYYYWSLMDNFEWAEGYDMKFGLYAMNRETLERTLRDGSKALIAAIERTARG